MLFINILKESFLFAYSSVMANKLRTLLTLLGITIGIFALISVFTILDSMENNIRESISGLGNDIVYIQKWPWSFSQDYPWWKYMKRPVPKLSDYKEIQRRSLYAQSFCFSATTSTQIKYGKNSADNIIVWGNSHEFQNVRPFEIEKGRYFSPFESENGRPCAIIGNDVAANLFKKENPLGKELKIMGRKVTILGIAKKEGEFAPGGSSLDNTVLLPINYMRNLYDIRNEDMQPNIMVKAKAGISTPQLIDELTGIMRSIHRLKPGQDDDFALNQASIISQGINSIFLVIDIAGGIIGGFSILVGGFGIANIMFVSVRERINIIGIQKALGAKKLFILMQFLYEAAILALAGGIIGLFFVFLGALALTKGADFHVTLSLLNIIKGLAISLVIGIVSGFAPAYSAAQLNPVEAINTNI